jgi:hypothetical protein
MFILHTPNPAMDSESIPDDVRAWSKNLLKKECDNLLSEINRLEKGRIMQDRRLKNVMNLVCAIPCVSPLSETYADCTSRFSAVSISGIVNACRD